MTHKADLERVARLKDLVARYMPRVMAEGAVRTALRGQGLPEDACPPMRFLQVLEAVKTGLKVLVAEDRLPSLLDEIGKMSEDYEAVSRVSTSMASAELEGRKTASSGRITLSKREK